MPNIGVWERDNDTEMAHLMSFSGTCIILSSLALYQILVCFRCGNCMSIMACLTEWVCLHWTLVNATVASDHIGVF